MCKMLEEMREEAVMEDRIRNVKSFYNNGVSISLIAKSMDMSEDTVKKILTNTNISKQNDADVSTNTTLNYMDFND